MSWYDASNSSHNFGRNSLNGGSGRHTTERIFDDNTNFDPFPPSQRQYEWNCDADDIRSESERDFGPETGGTRKKQLRIYHPKSNATRRPGSSSSNNTQPVDQPRSRLPNSTTLSKRGAPSSSNIASSSAPRPSREDELRRKRQKLLEMDDWTGAKSLEALKPPEIQFPQYNKETPIWGWSQDEPVPTYPPSQRQRSQGKPLYDAFSVKKYSSQVAPPQRHSGQTSHPQHDPYGYGQSASFRHPDPYQSASYRAKGKGRASSIAPPVLRRESVAAPMRSGPPIGIHNGYSPYLLAPTSSSSMGHEHPSPAHQAFPSDHYQPAQQSSRQSSTFYHPDLEEPALETSPYFVEERPSTPSHSDRITTPSFVSTGRQSIVSGTLSQEEQIRFENDGLAILWPGAPGIPPPATTSPVNARSSTPERQSSQRSVEQMPEIEQEPEGYQPSPARSQESIEEVPFDKAPSAYDTVEQDAGGRDSSDQDNDDEEALEQDHSQEVIDQEEPVQGTCPEKLSTQPDTLQAFIESYIAVKAWPHAGSFRPPQPPITALVQPDNVPKSRVPEDGLFETNRVNIRAISDFDDGEDAIEDSEESEREAAMGTSNKATGRKNYARRAQELRGVPQRARRQ